MYVEHNMVFRSRNVCTRSAIFTFWFSFTGRETLYDDLVSPATIKLTQVFVQNARFFLPQLFQIWSFGTILPRSVVSNYTKIRPVGVVTDMCEQMDGWASRIWQALYATHESRLKINFKNLVSLLKEQKSNLFLWALVYTFLPLMFYHRWCDV